MALEPLLLPSPSVGEGRLWRYPHIPDHQLGQGYQFIAREIWSRELDVFACKAFPNHLRLTMPTYHGIIYARLMKMLADSARVPLLAPDAIDDRLGAALALGRGVGAPPAGFEKSTLPPPKSLQKSKNQAIKKAKELEGDEGAPGGIDAPKSNDHNELDGDVLPLIVASEAASDNAEGSKRNLAIVEPREFGKSTKAMVFVMNAVLNKRKKFILYISKSYEHAVKLVGPIKAEFESNEDLAMVYGDIKGRKWTEGELEFNLGPKESAKLLAVGRGQSVRGLKYLNWRPDLIILDDIEDDKEVENKELRLELQMWLDRQVMPGVDSATGNIVAFGTILHPDSLLANLVKPKDRLLKYSTFDVLFYGALDANERSIWEEKFSTAGLLEERRLDPFKFAQERMNQPIPIGSGMFKKEYFKYFTMEEDGIHEGERIIPLAECNLYLTCDIAMTEKSYSDYTVLMITAVSPDNEFFILEYTRQRWEDPDKILNELFRLNAKYPDIKMNGIEAVAAQKWLIVNLKKEMKKRNIMTIRFCELKADTDKLRRISQLQPRFAADGIFLRNHMATLEEELLLFPKSAHDDLSDALAYVPYLAKPGERLDVKPIRTKISYTYSRDGGSVLDELMNKSKKKGSFKEYQPDENSDEFAEEYEEVMIKRWESHDDSE